MSFIANTCNNIIAACSFPERLKTAKIDPFHKKYKTHNLQDFRLIASFPAIAKVIKKCLFSNLICHLNQFIPWNQFGSTNGGGCIKISCLFGHFK